MTGFRLWITLVSMVGFLPTFAVTTAQEPTPAAPAVQTVGEVSPPVVTGPVAPVAAEPAAPVAAAPQAPAAPTTPADQLPAMARAAKETFVPRTKADLEQARARLQEAVNGLNERLQTAGAEAADWRKYLMWDELQKQLARPEGPELAELDKVYARFASGEEGLELVWFVTVRDALRQYLITARAIGDKNLPDEYKKLLDELAKHLEAYLKKPSPDEASAIAAGIDWLESAGQAKELVQAIRSNFACPNLHAQASSELVAAAIARSIDEIQPIEDCILEVAIRGTGHARGQATPQLVPNPERAQVDLVFAGTVNSKTVGYAERNVQVFSTGITQLTTRKPIFFEPERIWTGPSGGEAQTATNIDDIEAQRWLVERIAWRRARQQQPMADGIAAQHAAQRANARANEQGDSRIARTDQRYQDRVRRPLFEQNLYPQKLHYYSTSDALHAVGLEAGEAELGAPNPPPSVAQPLDLTVQLHESAVNNAIERTYGGAVMTEKRFQDTLTRLLGTVPERFKAEKKGEPWTITFVRRQPISVNFTGANQLAITVRGRSYSRGDERYPGMNVTANYRLEPSPEGVKAVRQGEVEIYPPGFQPGAGKQLSVRQQVLRDLLKRRFDKMFDKEFRPKDIQLKMQQDDDQGQEQQQDIGSLTLVGWEVNSGWMTMSWKRLPPAPVAPVQTAEIQTVEAQPGQLQSTTIQPAVLTQPGSATEAAPPTAPVEGQPATISPQTY